MRAHLVDLTDVLYSMLDEPNVYKKRYYKKLQNPGGILANEIYACMQLQVLLIQRPGKFAVTYIGAVKSMQWGKIIKKGGPFYFQLHIDHACLFYLEIISSIQF